MKGAGWGAWQCRIRKDRGKGGVTRSFIVVPGGGSCAGDSVSWTTVRGGNSRGSEQKNESETTRKAVVKERTKIARFDFRDVQEVRIVRFSNLPD